MSLGIFLKAPLPGQVKTRLCPPLSAVDAASLYTSFLADTLQAAAACAGQEVLLFYEGAHPTSYLAPTLTAALLPSVVEIAQRGSDLGERLEAAVGDAAERGSLPLLILGSDSPDLPAGHLTAALAALPAYDLVLGPASDGGVWCIGVRRALPGLLLGIAWSRPTVAVELRARAAARGLRVGDADAWYDVDTIGDLYALGARLAGGGAGAAYTARWLARYQERQRTDGETERR